jgi:hypothetical protein
LLPLEVGAGDVTEDGAELTALFFEEDRKVRGDEPLWRDGDERGKGVSAHIRVQDGEVIDVEVFWCVHECSYGRLLKRVRCNF